MAKVILFGYIEVPEPELEPVKKALEQHIELTLQEVGCLTFEVTQRNTTPTIFDVYEEFSSQEDFEFHQQRVKNSEWGEVSKNIKRCYQFEQL